MNTENTHKGFALVIAIVTTSMLLLVSFVVANVATKQLILAHDAVESQYAFYAADSGVECAQYWDTRNPNTTALSAFDINTPDTISCNGQGISTGTEHNIPDLPNPPRDSLIGGGGAGSVSLFRVNFTKGCAIVRVTKGAVNTTIESRGYNTCDVSADRRFERGITITY